MGNMTPTDDEAALAIDLTSMCKAFHVLPRAGGLLDQDYYTIRLLQAGLRAFAILEELEMEKAKKGGH